MKNVHLRRLSLLLVCAGLIGVDGRGSEGAVSVEYHYDAAGRVSAAVYSVGADNAALRFEYDPAGNMTHRLQIGVNDPAFDSDADGLGDLVELRFFGSLNETGTDDHDGDGVSNGDELTLGGNPTLRDTDADGSTDWEEYVAGTRLDDDTSQFVIQPDPITTPGQVEVVVPVLAGRTYQLQSATGLPGTWTDEGAAFVAESDGEHTWSLVPGTIRFYRLSVSLTLPPNP